MTTKRIKIDDETDMIIGMCRDCVYCNWRSTTCKKHKRTMESLWGIPEWCELEDVV
jgi:hypothetical protein